jgi:hypothetical protein
MNSMGSSAQPRGLTMDIAHIARKMLIDYVKFALAEA